MNELHLELSPTTECEIVWDIPYFYDPPLDGFIKANLTATIKVTHSSTGTCKSYNGVAFCSMKDDFDLEKGKKIALARAMKSWTKDARTKVWETYRTLPRW